MTTDEICEKLDIAFHVFMGALAGFVLCLVIIANSTPVPGYEQGVLDHADGKAVVDTLSNGQRVVTKLEAKP